MQYEPVVGIKYQGKEERYIFCYSACNEAGGRAGAYLNILPNRAMVTIESIFTKDNMMRAAKKVAKKSSAGIDGIPANEICKIVEQNYKMIINELVNSQYHPQEVYITTIPKRDGKVRNIAIATAIDRCLQSTLNMCLYPLFEPEWSEYSYGFRKLKNCKMAIHKAMEYMQDGYIWAIKLDLSGCFDNINQNKILYRIRNKICDKRVLNLIKKYLKITYISKQDKWLNEKGTPQGSPLSPLFAEIVMTDIDNEFQNRGIKFVRYADDILILSRTQTSAKRVMNNAIRFIQNKCNLPVNQDKTCCVSVNEGISYLGFCLYENNGKIHLVPQRSRIDSLRSKIKNECLTLKPDKIVERINEITKGWIEYYIETECHACCRNLDLFIKKQLDKSEKRNNTAINRSSLISCTKLYEEKGHLLHKNNKADGTTQKNEKNTTENNEASLTWCRDPPDFK